MGPQGRGAKGGLVQEIVNGCVSPAPRRLVYRAVVDPTVDFLARLAGMGPALELGIGTGRIALPLSRRGVRVHEIDFSPAMVAQLRRREGAAATDVTIGDFATIRPGGTFRLVYLLRNTITNLTHTRRALQTFHNVAVQIPATGGLTHAGGLQGKRAAS